MKFRSLVLLSALAALSVPAVEVTGSNTFGGLKVDSRLVNTIVAVPWVECGTGEAIKVANLVKTDNLTAGDKLYVYMGGTWYLYVLTDGAWTASTTVGANGPEVAEAPANQTLARGAALFLQRADATKPFYLYGQYDATAVQTAITAGTVDAPIGRHPTDRKRQAVTEKNSRPAVTHYEVIARYNGYTHVRCILETGRTHQIRVHMAHIGHPLLGDMVYGRKKAEKGLEGQCLHARCLKFTHPRTGERVVLETELPEYFTDVLKRLGTEL